MDQDAATTPVIVGVGQVNDRPEDLAHGLDSLDLMAAALRLADADAGGFWMQALQSLSVVNQISCPWLGDMSRPLAQMLGAAPRLCEITQTAHGDYPIRLLNQAANRIGAGEIEVAAIVGGEALRTAARRAAAEAGGTAASHSAIDAVAASAASSLRARFGLVTPTEVYPLYENAARAAYGQTLAEAQAETGEIWSRFSDVAAANDGAWLRRRVSAAQICTPSADNRPLAHPYLKLMVANSSVNQGAGFIVTNLALARRRGVPEDRILYVGHGAAAHEPEDFLARDRYDESPGMIASLTRAMAMNGVGATDLDLVELYSCYPCVPKMARRVLGWPADRPASVVGGLTFGGGPIGNYMSHAVVSMVRRLRDDPGRGLLFANGGFASHNHTILLSSTQTGTRFPQDFDVQEAADAARGSIPILVEGYAGAGTIETYTVLYARDGSPRFGVIVGRAPGGQRFLAKVAAANAEAIAFLTDGRAEPVGSTGFAVAEADGDPVWHIRADG